MPPPDPTRTIPTSGSIRLRVRYAECDPQGVAHHSSFVPWLEMGRTELLRDAGLSYAQLEAAGVFLVVVKLECSYRRAARYDDLVEIRTRVVQSSRVKLRHEYEVHRLEAAVNESDAPAAGGGSELLLTASTLLACVDRAGRPAMMPQWLVDLAREPTV